MPCGSWSTLPTWNYKYVYVVGYRHQRQGKMRLNPGQQHIPGVLQALYGLSIILVAQEVTEEFKVGECHNQISTLKKITLAIK